jgi:hypothetical protein
MTQMRTIALVVVALAFSTVAQAAPVTYVQTGIGSGTLGSLTFVDALVRFTMTGDTDDVGVALSLGDIDGDGTIDVIYGNLSSETTVEIAGLPTATVLELTAIFAFPLIEGADDLPPFPSVMMGTVDDLDLADEGFIALGATATDDLLGYDLRTSIGPITRGGGVGYSPEHSIDTTLGALSFRHNLELSEDSTFTATVTPTSVPEPMSALLLFSGTAVVAGGSRLRRRR